MNPEATPVTAGLRARVVQAVHELSDPDRLVDDAPRPIDVAWRDALDYANLPPGQIAELFAGHNAPQPSDWTDLRSAAPFLVPAALGGHPGAVEALDDWCRAGDTSPNLRAALCRRLQQRVPDHPRALDYLLLDAARSADPFYLVEPVDELASSAPDLLATFDRPLISTVTTAIVSSDPNVRSSGYRVLAAMITAYADPPRWLPPLAEERNPGVLNAMLDVIQAALEQRADGWPTGADPNLLTALDTLTGRHGLGERPTDLRHSLLCRTTPIGTPEERRQALAVAATMIRDGGRPVLRQLGYLISRLAEMDLDSAASLLCEASRWIAANGSATASWKSRRAKRWRTPIRDIVQRQRRTTWLAMMRELAAADLFIMNEAIDISLWSRPLHPENDLAALLAEVGASDRVQRAFTAARRRHHRVAGGATTWPELPELVNEPEKGR